MPDIIRWLLPKEEEFFDRLKEQSSNAVRGAEEFNSLIGSYNSLSEDQRVISLKKIKDIEHTGDDLAHNIISNLDKTFITPIDKEDIHSLVMLLDDVIDLINTTAERLIIFKISKIDIYIKNLNEVVFDIAKKIDNGIFEVRKLKNMNKFYIDVHTLENKGDEIYRNALIELFGKANVIDIIKYKEIYELMENIIDKCESIANVMESIVVKHA